MRVAVLDDYQNVALSLADWSGLDVTVFTEPLADPAAQLRGFEIVCIMRERTPFPRALFQALPDLKLLVTSGARNLAIDVAAAREQGVVVCGTDSPGHATAELTFALILALTRKLTVEDRNVREGRWQTTLGEDLRGKTLGVIGLGRLGGQVAAIGAAFGMRILGWSRNLTDARAAECGATRVAKEDLFRRADIVTIHMKYSDAIRHLVGTSELALMKPSAYLVNTSRAPIVDMAALGQALRAGRLAGAGIDVYDVEPLPAGDDARAWPRTVLTPHIGYVTRETYEVFYRQTAEAVRAFMAGKPIRVMDA